MEGNNDIKYQVYLHCDNLEYDEILESSVKRTIAFLLKHDNFSLSNKINYLEIDVPSENDQNLLLKYKLKLPNETQLETSRIRNEHCPQQPCSNPHQCGYKHINESTVSMELPIFTINSKRFAIEYWQRFIPSLKCPKLKFDKLKKSIIMPYKFYKKIAPFKLFYKKVKIRNDSNFILGSAIQEKFLSYNSPSFLIEQIDQKIYLFGTNYEYLILFEKYLNNSDNVWSLNEFFATKNMDSSDEVTSISEDSDPISPDTQVYAYNYNYSSSDRSISDSFGNDSSIDDHSDDDPIPPLYSDIPSPLTVSTSLLSSNLNSNLASSVEFHYQESGDDTSPDGEVYPSSQLSTQSNTYVPPSGDDLCKYSSPSFSSSPSISNHPTNPSSPNAFLTQSSHFPPTAFPLPSVYQPNPPLYSYSPQPMSVSQYQPLLPNSPQYLVTSSSPQLLSPNQFVNQTQVLHYTQPLVPAMYNINYPQANVIANPQYYVYSTPIIQPPQPYSSPQYPNVQPANPPSYSQICESTSPGYLPPVQQQPPNNLPQNSMYSSYNYS